MSAKFFIFNFTFLILNCLPLAAQQPLYIVNGVERSSMSDIPPEVIERIEELPADEFTIERYGRRGANGVVIVTLRYDKPARFCTDTLSLTDYLRQRVEWDATEPTARVSLRYRILTDGRMEVIGEPVATNKRLLKRVLKALAEAPLWQPATKQGVAVETEQSLTLQLPEGRRMVNYELIVR